MFLSILSDILDVAWWVRRQWRDHSIVGGENERVVNERFLDVIETKVIRIVSVFVSVVCRLSPIPSSTNNIQVPGFNQVNQGDPGCSS
jgi:hypothetical protein